MATNSDYVHFEDCGCEKCLPYMHEDELPAGAEVGDSGAQKEK